MKLRNQWILNILMVSFSWIFIPFLGERAVKRYFPAALFAILLTSIDVQIGKRRRWWQFYNKPMSYVQNEFPFLLGPMFFVSIWTLKIAYGNFLKFMCINAFFQGMFTFIFTKLFTKLKLFKLVHFNPFQFFLYFFYKVFFLYGFQYCYENVVSQRRKN